MALISLKDLHVLTNPYNSVMLEILLLHLFFQMKTLYTEKVRLVTQLMADWDLNTLSKALEFLT